MAPAEHTPVESLDPVTARVIGGRLTSIAQEMSSKLVRMGFSILIKESEDIGCALVDTEGWQLAEALDVTPLQMGPIPYYVRGVLSELERTGGEVNPGDVFIHNSSYLGASHSPDIAFIVPVFHEGELVAFSATTAHHLDIGGGRPGTSVLDAVDVWAEGLQFLGLKIRDRGVDCQPLWKLIEDNVRVPQLVIGDMRAQIAACEMGAERLVALLDDVGRGPVFAAQRWLEDYAERMLRHEIALLPDGDYRAKGVVDGFPDHPVHRELPIAVTLRVRGDELEIDLTGTAPQLDNLPLNMPLEGTVTSAILTVVRSVLLDTETHAPVPQNRGIMRPLKITAPAGTLVNPTFPAPTLARAMPACILSDTVVRAFAKIVPERCCAGCGPLSVFVYSGLEDGRYWVHMDISEGSYGARFAKDGMDAMDTLFTNTRCAPVEEIETEYPLRCTRWELNDYPVGHGRFRGGKGGVRDFEFLGDGYISSEADGHLSAPWGMDGGRAGHPGGMWANPNGATPEKLSSKLPGRPTTAGEVYRVVAANGGGTGSPRERDPQLVLADLLDGIISAEEARDVYGVVIGRDGATVDETATAARRSGATGTIAGALAERLERDAGGVFYVDGEHHVSVEALADDVDAAARALVGLGVAPGDRVVLWLPNGRLWIALFFACARIGAVVVTAGPRLRLADLPHMLEQSEAHALFYAPEFLGVDYDEMAAKLVALRGDNQLASLEQIVRCGDPNAGPSAPDGVRDWHETEAASKLPALPAPDAPAVICYTGGTSGQTRGCVHDHATLVRNATIAAELTAFGPGERLVSAMPFAHVFGFHMSILQPLIAGASLIEAEPFDAPRVLDLVAGHGATVVYGVPAMASELIRAQLAEPRVLASLRVALIAGAPVSPKLRRRTAEVLDCGVAVVYGATESPTLTQLAPEAPEPAWLESVGRATPGIELAILEPGGTRRLGPGEVGEIAARGYNHMVGYLGDPEATAAKYRDGWIIPGDFGRLDAEGFLYVVGRSAEMFLCGGFNVYPREVENQLELLTGVEEAVVVAVPDERLGEVALAYVTVEADGPSEAAVLAWANEQMASYKRPRYARILTTMPRTHVGKTARGELAERARSEFPDLPWDTV